MVGRLRNLLQPANWRFIGPVPRSINDYATHVPVLLGLAKVKPIRSVLELGAGHYSTKTFLDRRSFPDLQLLHSYETDKSWGIAMKQILDADSRASLHLIEGSMANALESVDLGNYDLIFVDDSTNASERVRTIKTVRESRMSSALVVIHDFEVPEYINVAKPFRYRYSFKAFNPETGVVWQNGFETRYMLKKIDEIMRQHAQRLEPDDTDGWHAAFAQVTQSV